MLLTTFIDLIADLSAILFCWTGFFWLIHNWDVVNTWRLR
jgi:hypothetical protein